MIAEKDLNKFLNRLFYEEEIQIHCGGTDVAVSLVEHGSKFLLVACVYEGVDYIPLSVRKCVGGKTPFAGGWIHTNIKIDEAHYKVLLNYTGDARPLNSQNIKDILEEFSWQADEWRLYLDEHDKHDLMHIYVK